MRKSGCLVISLLFIAAAALLWGFSDGGGQPYAEPTSIIRAAEPVAGSREITPDPYSGTLLLVNAKHPLPDDYYPENLLTIYGNVNDRPFALARADIAIRTDALDALVKMLDAAGREGKKNYLLLSGFRDYAKQASLFEGAEPQGDYLDTQPPGASEHQTGLAVDLCKQSVDMRGFLDTSEGAWVINHAASYGFVLRFEEGKSELTGVIYEPWHFRYVGTPHAQIMVNEGYCLEEYIEWLREEGCVRVSAEDGEYEIKAVKSETVSVAEGAVVSGDNCGGFIVTTKISR